VLGVGSEGRMNLPGTSSGNWHWRYRAEDLTIGIGARLKLLAQTYDRQPVKQMILQASSRET